MRGRSILLTMIAVVMVGCTTPQAPPPPAVEQPPAVERPPQAGVERRDNGWEISTLKSANQWYLWSPDLSWIAFQTSTGLWAVSPDGASEHLLQPGDRWRLLAGWWEGSLVFIDYDDGSGDATVRAASPGGPLRTIAELPGPSEPLQHTTALYGPHLGVWSDGARPLRLDLRTGDISEMETEGVDTRCAPAWPSQTGRHVIIKNACEWEHIRLYDLAEGTVLTTEQTAYPYGVVWAPTEDRWGALASEPGSGDSDGGAFGSYIDVGDTDLKVKRLTPPVPMKLRGTWASGPWWSPDGTQLAVMREVAPPGDSRYRDAVNEIWVVTIATNEWRKLARVTFVHVLGWHPSGEHLVVWEIVASAGAWGMGRMSVADGRLEWLEPRRPEDWPQTEIDDRLWVVSAPRWWGEPTAYSGRLPLAAAQQYRASDLQFRGSYVSYLEDHAAGPTLVVTRRQE